MDADPGASVRCAVLARAVDAPMAGTAPQAAGWVCVEQRGAWPRTVEAHPEPAIAALGARAAAAGRRMVLIRRPGRVSRVGQPIRVFVADVTPEGAHTVAHTVASPAELDDVDVLGRTGTPWPDPLLLVCTHGRRDRCCAVDGRALAAAVVTTGLDQVWETSHLGGHRFAPTALVLPSGYLYGRLDVDIALSALKAAGRGEVESGSCRGRSVFPPAGQVADLAVRQLTGIRDAHALTVRPGVGDTQLVTALDGRRWTVPVQEVVGPALPGSCGAAVLPTTALVAGAPRLISG